MLRGDIKNGIKHLNDCCALYPLRKIRDIKQSILKPKIDNEDRVLVGTYAFDEDDVRKKLSSMIIPQDYPLSMVEHEYFQRSFSANISGRNTVKKDTLEIYEQKKLKTTKLLENNDSKFVITDLWPLSNKKKGLLQ